MSILLSVVTPYCATQVSDMQVTAFADGQPLSQEQRKTVVYSGDNVRCLVGWVGLAMIENHNTGDWLHRQLDAMMQDDPPLDVFVESLANSASLHFATLKARDKRTEFAFAGWFRVGPDRYAHFSATISNFTGRPWELSSSHGPQFHYGCALQTRPSKHPYEFSVAGYEEAVRQMPMYFRGLRGLLQRRVAVPIISGACRQIAAVIAAKQAEKRALTPDFIKTVGDSQLTVELDPSGSVNTFSSKDGVVTRGFPADIVSPLISTKGMQVERKVELDGTINMKVKGWIKANKPNTVMSFPGAPVV